MIKAKCINDQNKPKEIPDSKWIKKDNFYHITYVYKMLNQNNIKGCELSEIELDESCLPYNCFRLDRFSILEEDLEKLIELIESCSEENRDIIEELLKESNLQIEIV